MLRLFEVKRFPFLKRKSIGYFWLIALGLHGVLFAMPISTSKPSEQEKPLQVVKLAKLPAQRPALKTKQAVKPSPAKPKVLPKVKKEASAVSGSAQPSSVQQEQPVKKEQQTAKASSPKSTEPPEQPDQSLPGNVLVMFSKDAGATKACQSSKDGCWQTDETQWRSVAGKLEQHFEQEGYAVAKLDDLEDEQGMGIYEVSKPGSPTQYLHFLLTDRGTVYYLDPKRLNRNELEAAIGV